MEADQAVVRRPHVSAKPAAPGAANAGKLSRNDPALRALLRQKEDACVRQEHRVSTEVFKRLQRIQSPSEDDTHWAKLVAMSPLHRETVLASIPDEVMKLAIGSDETYQRTISRLLFPAPSAIFVFGPYMERQANGTLVDSGRATTQVMLALQSYFEWLAGPNVRVQPPDLHFFCYDVATEVYVCTGEMLRPANGMATEDGKSVFAAQHGWSDDTRPPWDGVMERFAENSILVFSGWNKRRADYGSLLPQRQHWAERRVTNELEHAAEEAAYDARRRWLDEDVFNAPRVKVIVGEVVDSKGRLAQEWMVV